MRVLVVGGGGREHALCAGLAASASVEQVLAAPGNPGMARVAALRALEPTDPDAVARLAEQESVDLVVVGGEAPLVAGVADALERRGVPVFGPTAAAARIESSKAFAKDVMAAAGVATAAAWHGDDVAGALAALDRHGPPYVVKADGLAAGKGVVVTGDREQAEAAVRAALEHRRFGAAGDTVVVEAHLAGREVSVFAVCDGAQALVLPPARDHKRALDGDRGPNTGGMGAFSPVPDAPADLGDRVLADVVRPVLAELAARGTPYRGVLYVGLVLTDDGPTVLEFNARFGDPEAQVVLPRLRSDLGALLAACAHGELGALRPLEVDDRAAVTVVLASGGYPGPYATGATISGLDTLEDEADVTVFHAGTAHAGDRLETAGGRVLAVTGLGSDVADARARAYAAADRVSFDGLHRRDDIAGTG